MKNLVLVLLLIFVTLSSKSQDTIRLTHTNYVSLFSKSLHYPLMVEWWNTRKEINTKHIPRKDQFQKDPLLPDETDLANDYKGSHYDRGHMSPAIDNESLGEKVLTECFYFSNMVPQPHSLNAGDWKSVESLSDNLSKQYDSIHVWAGGAGVIKKIGKVSVPKYCWKIIYIKKTNEYFYYLFDNLNVEQTGVHSHEVTKEDLEKVVSVKIN